MFKKLLISFLVSLVFFISLAPCFSVKAQATFEGSWYDQNFQEWWGKVYDNDNPSEIFGERYTAAQVQWIIYSLFSFTLKASGIDAKTTACFINNDVADCLEKVKGLFKLAEIAPNPMAINEKQFIPFMLKDKPLSGITYTKTLLRKFALIPEAKAATPGFGFEALDPVLPLWKASRNIAYMLLVLATLVLAFMIMFRVKISPQVVISIQSAIPKVVAGVILITFSYAIAGFLVDFMYVVIGLVSLLISQATGMFTPNDYFLALTQGPGGTGIFGWIIGYLILFAVSMASALYFSNGIIGFLASVVTLWVGILSILGIIAFIIVLIVVIFNTFKILWMLFKTFANILLLTIFAPFQILLGVVTPAGGIGPWLKSFASNLAVFPITGILFVLAFTFCIQSFIFSLSAMTSLSVVSITDLMGQFIKGTVAGLIFAPMYNMGWPPLLGAGQSAAGLIFAGASVVVITLIPKTVDMIQAFIQGKPFAYGTDIGVGGTIATLKQTGITAGETMSSLSRLPVTTGYITDTRTGQLTKLGKLLDRLRWFSFLPNTK